MKISHILGNRDNKTEHYDINLILSTKATYYMLLGGRSIGKTYSIISRIIDIYMNSGKYSVYCRKTQEEIKKANIDELVTAGGHRDISAQTGGKWNSTVFKSNAFYFCNKYEKGIQSIDKNPFLYVTSVNNWENQKGADRGSCAIVFYDEFLSRNRYIINEFSNWQNLVSNYVRNDIKGVELWFSSNTVQFTSPFFTEFCLIDTINTLKQGDIKVLENDKGMRLAIEYCPTVKSTQESSKIFSFGSKKSSDMITQGKWETNDYKALNWTFNDNDIICTYYIIHQHKIIKVVCVSDSRGRYLYADLIENDTIMLSEYDYVYDFEPSPYKRWAVKYQIVNYKAQKIFNELLNANKIYYNIRDDISVGELIRTWIIECNKYHCKVLS